MPGIAIVKRTALETKIVQFDYPQRLAPAVVHTFYMKSKLNGVDMQNKTIYISQTRAHNTMKHIGETNTT